MIAGCQMVLIHIGNQTLCLDAGFVDFVVVFRVKEMNLFDLIKITDLAQQLNNPNQQLLSDLQWVTMFQKIIKMCDCTMPDGSSTLDRNGHCRFCGRSNKYERV